MEKDLSAREEQLQMKRFENCLGKHTDSFEHGLQVLYNFMQSKRDETTTFDHSGDVNSISGTAKPVYEVSERGEQYLLSQRMGSNEPVYDSPIPKPKQESAS